MKRASPVEHCSKTETNQHWQDFDGQVTIQASQAGQIYRAMHSVRGTLKMIADHHMRMNSGGDLAPRFSSVELEAMLAGALALTNMVDEVFEELHFQDAEKE